MTSILSNSTRHVTEVRSILPSPVRSRLSAARIGNREYCCATPWLRSSPDHERSRAKRFGWPTLRMNDSYFFTDREHLLFSTQSLERADLKVFLRELRTSRIRCRQPSRWLRRRKA